MIFAAIDMGTNSCRLLISRYNDGKPETILRQIRTNRLGEGMGISGMINEQTMEITAQCLITYKQIMQDHKVDAFHVVATSAVREAKNQAEFISFLRKVCGMEPEVISGQREAELSYAGAINEWEGEKKPFLIDLGGGSTEIIWHTDKAGFISLPLGAVRATEADMSAADIADLIASLGNIKEELSDYPLVMVGGTATTLVAVKLALEVYDPEKVHGKKLSRGEIGDIYNMLASMPLRLRRRMPGLQPERADIIVKGVLIILLLMDYLNKNEITVSEKDILDGIIKELYYRSLQKD